MKMLDSLLKNKSNKFIKIDKQEITLHKDDLIISDSSNTLCLAGVIGGLDSIPGAIVGSLIIGLTQGYVAYFQFPFESATGIILGSGFSLLAPYLIMFVILIVKPDGLFGTEEVERV